MGLYAQRVLPRIIEAGCVIGALAPYRQRVCDGLRGEVIELGFGSGPNVPYYPDTVRQVTAVEPADLGWRLAEERVRDSIVPVRRAGLDGQRLPFPDDSFDAALSTWTMCTIPDICAALAELHRVLRPGGALHFLEHGLAPDPGVRRLQRLLEPVNKVVMGGCHLTRQMGVLVAAAGFSIKEIDEFYEPGSPKVVGADTLGVAVTP
ncbi:MAG TPA: class I SAM-dependent methyltransferase [Nocardioidaceae bacterium]|nr:class I SAM-dependent methyltransferase [Nocardioidaceae bacterium]